MKQWKQLDQDFGANVVVDEDNHYVSTACNATAAKLFITAYNTALTEAYIQGGSDSRKNDIAKFLPMLKKEIEEHKIKAEDTPS